MRLIIDRNLKEKWHDFGASALESNSNSGFDSKTRVQIETTAPETRNRKR